MHEVSQCCVLPKWAKGGLFERPAATSEFNCSLFANVTDIFGDESEDFVDLKDEVGHDEGWCHNHVPDPRALLEGPASIISERTVNLQIFNSGGNLPREGERFAENTRFFGLAEVH